MKNNTKRVATFRRKASILLYAQIAKTDLGGWRSGVINEAIARIHFIDVATVYRVISEDSLGDIPAEVIEDVITVPELLKDYCQAVIKQRADENN